MSLNATSASCSDKLRTADQHDAWRVRISDKCWAKTGKDILAVTNAACKAALTKLHDEAKTADERAAHSWVSTCWLMITKSLHDDILMKVAHVERGCIETLLKEIAASLVVSTLDEGRPAAPGTLRSHHAERLQLGFANLHRFPSTPTTKADIPPKTRG